MSRMPKILFFVLFFVGTMGGVWLNQNGYFGPRSESGPPPAFIGFALAMGTAFLLFTLFRLMRWVKALSSNETRDGAQAATLLFLKSRPALIGVTVFMFYLSMIGGALLIRRGGWLLLAITIAGTALGTAGFYYLVRLPRWTTSYLPPANSQQPRR